MKDMAMETAIGMGMEAARPPHRGAPEAAAIRPIPAVVESPLPLQHVGMSGRGADKIGQS